eukprot:740318-Rhodomonas_salina.1
MSKNKTDSNDHSFLKNVHVNDPENDGDPESDYDPENDYVPENEYDPENDFDPESEPSSSPAKEKEEREEAGVNSSEQQFESDFTVAKSTLDPSVIMEATPAVLEMAEKSKMEYA